MAIALYARKSVEKENSISCETQLEYCKAVIKPDERGEKLMCFVDNGFSGGNLNRAGFREMMRLVREKKISKIIVYKLDRISRSLTDFVKILQEFKEYGVEFVSSQESFDTSSAYGEMIVKLLMVFAEFERTSIINRVTQAYAHRSELGFYMGGRRPYGFELVPAVIGGISTKKLSAAKHEAEKVRYMFAAYARGNISLRSLAEIVNAGENDGHGELTAPKISAVLKNPLYVRTDAEIYGYFDKKGVRIVNDISEFTGKFGAQLYGRTKHDGSAADMSDMKLVLMRHEGLVSAEIWLECQKKLEKNKRLHKSLSNKTSCLAGKVVCGKCGRTMTVIKGKPNLKGETRRYFNCAGKSQKRACGGTVTIYAESLEIFIDECIARKLSKINYTEHAADRNALNELKLRVGAIEISENKLAENIISGNFNSELVAVANRKAAELEKEKRALCEKMERMKSKDTRKKRGENLEKLRKKADERQRRDVFLLIIEKIEIEENGDVKVFWNI